METTNYTHLSDASVDDILKRFGIATTTTSTPEPQTASQTDTKVPLPFEDDEETPTETEENTATEVVHVDSDSIISDIIGSTPSVSTTREEPQQQQPIQENLPKIIVRNSYFDNVFMSRFVGAQWAGVVPEKTVLVAGMGGIGRF